MPNKNFTFKNLPLEAQDTSIKAKDFKLVNSKGRIHEQRFQTRPTTFFKDSLKRFSKNKSSVVASFILGILLLLSVVIPFIDSNDVKSAHPELTYLEPKLFDSKIGFWDGTKEWSKIPAYIPTLEDGSLDLDKSHWKPNPDQFNENAISNVSYSDFTYTNGESKYGRNGYVQFGYYSNIQDSTEYVAYRTKPFSEDLLASDTVLLKTLDTYDENKLKSLEGNKDIVKFPENYTIGKLALYFCYDIETDSGVETSEIELLSPKEVYNVGSMLSSLKEDSINLTNIIKSKTNDTSFNNGLFEFRIDNTLNHANTCALIRAIEFDASGVSNSTLKNEIEANNFLDATSCNLRSSKADGYWASTGVKNIYLSQIVYSSFTYDSYEAAFGVQRRLFFPIAKLEEYATNGWIIWDVYSYDPYGDGLYYEITPDSTWEVIDEVNSPVVEFLTVGCDELSGEIYCDVMLSYYKYYEYTEMPKFLLGTDKQGKDMLKYVFEGLRTSLLLGIITFVVCFIFGLIWGSVCGYFGGVVDLVMERFTDILAGVPWIVVMTLAIIKFGSTFGTFVLSLCLTGWIGTAATTRTQFYRFRGREYVLASRTLGASNARLISKHILPNAMGTIITSSVLMIPSVIFSEATISYLGLGLKNLSSLGVILSDNQSELTTNSYLLIFPSIVIALLMISFNLFGNGLRDAVNPSLKGEGE